MKVHKVLVPKEALEKNLKEQLKTQFEEEMQKLGVKSFRYIDIEWDANGIILYYENTESKE